MIELRGVQVAADDGTDEVRHSRCAAELADRIESARAVVAFTGAGMSAESGLSTFRNREDGPWSAWGSRRCDTVIRAQAGIQLAAAVSGIRHAPE